MFTLIIQIWIVGTCAALLALVIRDQRRDNRNAVEAGRRAAEQTWAACKAREAGAEAARIGSEMIERGLRPDINGRWKAIERNSLRGVPPRLDYLRTPLEMRAIRERIISETSATIAECRERRRIQGSN